MNRNNTRRRTKQKATRPKPNRPRQDPQAQISHLNALVRVPKQMKGPFPYSETIRIRTYFRYVMQGAAPYLVLDFKLNDVYNPIPASGSLGLSAGYAGSASRYTAYHVQGIQVKISLSCNENFSVTGGLVFSDTQESTVITSYALAERAFVSTGCAHRAQLATQTGQGRSVFPTFKIAPSSILGNPMVYYSDTNFVSSYGSSPAQVVWGAVILISDTILTNLTNGAFVDIDLTQITRNYSPSPLA